MAEKYEVGNVFINKRGEKYKIIDILEKDRIKIRFLNTDFEKIITRQTIKALGGRDDSKRLYELGKSFVNNDGCEFIIVEKIDSIHRRIKFLDKYGYEPIVATTNILSGTIKNPYTINVYSVGCIGEFPPIKNPKNGKVLYEVWRGMLRRCYYMADYNKNTSYKNTTVCEEWLNFSNFHKWAIEKYFDGSVLDKDMFQLKLENKVYSPETCIFLPQKINNFIISKFKTKTPYFRDGRYEVRGVEFLSDKSIALGCFTDLSEARKHILNFEKIQVGLVIDYLVDLNIYDENCCSKLLKLKSEICGGYKEL